MKKSISEEDDIKEEDVIGEVHFEIDKDAFKGPVSCCSEVTYKTPNETWKCDECQKEYVDWYAK